MGDLGEEADKLDEQIWGSDEEQDEEQSNVCTRYTPNFSFLHTYFPDILKWDRYCEAINIPFQE